MSRVAVTGGARGIGRAIARRLVADGMTVVIADRDGDVAERTAAEIGAQAFVVDVTDAAQVEHFVDAVGPLDVLVNNAGIMPVGPFLDEQAEATARQWDVNIGGVVNGCRAYLPRAIARGRGHVINVSSVAGRIGYGGMATYSGTKFYVFGFSEALRAELAGTGVHISVVTPGFVATELTTGIGEPRFVRRTTPERVADGVARAIAHPRFDVPVPGYVRPMSAVLTLLPRGVRDAALRAARADRLALEADAGERQAYEARAARTTDGSA